ncbi:hypothetical protein ILYODFUR_030255 [Ilyodon furcidens]|uniref:Uncharacterized protein n=1 Tax=Ilyodon furcidens TaxID=33524 RepID=A0ABV0TER2_9TELE
MTSKSPTSQSPDKDGTALRSAQGYPETFEPERIRARTSMIIWPSNAPDGLIMDGFMMKEKGKEAVRKEEDQIRGEAVKKTEMVSRLSQTKRQVDKEMKAEWTEGEDAGRRPRRPLVKFVWLM